MSRLPVAVLREELKRARQERAQLSEGWLDSLKAFLGDDAAPVCVGSEQREDVGEFAEIVEALPDDVLRHAQAECDRVFSVSRLKLHASDLRMFWFAVKHPLLTLDALFGSHEVGF